jgi:hypothetical protein
MPLASELGDHDDLSLVGVPSRGVEVKNTLLPVW